MEKGMKIAFNAVMANSKTVANKTYADIPVELLIVDDAYQRRSTTHRRAIQRLVDSFNYDLMDALKVSVREDTNQFAIYDGNHRFEAGVIRGLKTFPCEIIKVTGNVDTVRIREAEMFLGQKSDPLTLMQKHKARVLVGDPAAVAIEEATKKFGIVISNTHVNRTWKTPILQNYYASERAYIEGGVECLNYVYQTIEDMGWNVGGYGYTKYCQTALMEFWKKYHRDPEHLAKVTKIIVNFVRKQGLNPTDFKFQYVIPKYQKGEYRALLMCFVDIVEEAEAKEIHIIVEDDYVGIA